MAVSNNALLNAATAPFVNDAIDESDFIAVYDLTNKKSPEFQYWNYENVETQLQSMMNNECQVEFRVDLAVWLSRSLFFK
jgi:hypothetical protein